MESINKLINKNIFDLNNSDKTFKDIFEIIYRHGDRIFGEITNGYKIQKITYKECKEKIIKSALYLEEELKAIPKGDFVGLMMENSLNWINVFWGLLMIGYKPMLLNLRLNDVLLKDVIKLSNLSVVITDKNYNSGIEEIIYNEIETDKKEIIEKEFNWANEIALSTSATSLNIKVCVYTGYQIATQLQNTKRIVKDNPMIKSGYSRLGDIRIMTFLPLYHIFGLVATYFWFSFFGRTFVFLKDMSNDTILKTVRKHKVTHLFSVPMMWNTIYKEILKQVSMKDDKTKKKFQKGIKLSLKIQNICPKLGLKVARRLFKDVQKKVFGDSIRFLITGGSYISNDVLTLFNAIGYPIYNGYGMSEIGITSVELRRKAKHRNLGNIGRPFDTVKYRIGNDGSLEVLGDSICSKIITKNKVVEIDHSKWYNTNDIASCDKSGYYSIKGRLDDVVISSSGEKINPDLIEKNLYLPTVNRYCVIGLNNDNTHALSLILEINPNFGKLKIKKIIEQVDKNLLKLEQNAYLIEKIFYTYDRIASPQAIKVSRSILTKWIDNGTVKLMPYQQLKEIKTDVIEEIENEISEKVKKIMVSILNIEYADILSGAHFIQDLGATSLDYLTLLVKLKEEFELEFTFNESNNCYSVEEFVNYISKLTK